MNLKILNSREKKRIASDLARKYGVGENVLDGYDALSEGGSVWLTSRGCLEVGLGGLKVDSLGLQIMRDGVLTVHGVQLLLKSAPQVELTAKQAADFIAYKVVEKTGHVASYRNHPLDLAESTRGSSAQIKRRLARS